ncbi:N-formylglutamate amidohydrolase [Curvivirga aplysinae]|uniref:N-formylglutamate amidohydrolase n=1 Tax=Curvivirga aplysinae TaxID=2529852 RepID=UPI001C3F5763|nr:N-formylglutamate amidohydrolase [Curvivirga aplysinae]
MQNTKNLLTDQDGAAVHLVNEKGSASLIITCDHASNDVPKSLESLGLDQSILNQHMGYDIGAAPIAEILSEAFDAPAIFSGYSRLVIDINRPVDDFTSIRAISDGVIIPKNRRVTCEDKTARQEELYWPYHNRLAAIVDAKTTNDQMPIMISVHSCTDEMHGQKRPWHIGVLTNHDRRVGEALIAVLEEQNPDLMIGDNKPYSGWDPYGYTVENHAVPRGMPNVLLEVRQDLIADEAGQKKYAEILRKAFAVVLADKDLYTAF